MVAHLFCYLYAYSKQAFQYCQKAILGSLVGPFKHTKWRFGIIYSYIN